MSSDPQLASESLVIINYSSFAIASITAMVYDYLLTFPREVNYIWRRPWTLVSTAFVVVRYVGLAWVIPTALYGTPFVPGSEVHCNDSEGAIMYMVGNWGYLIFLIAADWVMILRVYSMWDRSKKIFYTLLFLYTSEIVVALVFQVIYYNNPPVVIEQVMDVSICGYGVTPPSLINWSDMLPRFPLATALLVLAVAQTFLQSFQMYNATRQWQPNKYMQLLTRDGIIYFLANMLYTASATATNDTNPNAIPTLSVVVSGYVAICTMTPRFIIGVRELYERDLRERWQGIDTGFGVLSQPTVNSAIQIDVPSSNDQITERELEGLEGVRLDEHSGGDICPV